MNLLTNNEFIKVHNLTITVNLADVIISKFFPKNIVVVFFTAVGKHMNASIFMLVQAPIREINSDTNLFFFKIRLCFCFRMRHFFVFIVGHTILPLQAVGRQVVVYVWNSHIRLLLVQYQKQCERVYNISHII